MQLPRQTILIAALLGGATLLGGAAIAGGWGPHVGRWASASWRASTPTTTAS